MTVNYSIGNTQARKGYVSCDNDYLYNFLYDITFCLFSVLLLSFTFNLNLTQTWPKPNA